MNSDSSGARRVASQGGGGSSGGRGSSSSSSGGSGSRLTVLLLASVVALQLATPAFGHGMMIYPMARNWIAYLQENYPWPHGLSMGGVAVVSDEGKLTYPAGKRNYCGDSWNETKWDNPGPVRTTYLMGQVINVDVLVAINHMGRFSVQVCQLDAKPGQGKCKNLYLKAPGHTSTKSWYLPGVYKWNGGNWGHDGPKYGDGTFEAYQLPTIFAGQYGCNGQAHCGSYEGHWVYRTQWMLPRDFKCDHCKLQWVWTTGHNCWPTCEPKNPMPQCQNPQLYGTCGSPGTAYPEEFVNCADIRVTDSGWIDPATSLAPWNSVAQIKSGYWGTVKPSVIHESD